MRFREKPMEIEAYQFPNYPYGWITCMHSYVCSGSDLYILLYTSVGEIKVHEGDWIIKDFRGEFYSCKNDMFRIAYEEI